MCGINGFLTLNSFKNFDLTKILADTTNRLVSRGPDSSGFWVDDQEGIYLGHRRLSIVDLSENGMQPMSSNGGRFVICLNGEIYNHLELRDELNSNEGINIVWQSCSDTETLINCIEVWGIENTLLKLVGMYSFAIWDKQYQELTIVRDRFGEKPLYYGWIDEAFFFSSELKAIKSNPIINLDIDRNSIAMLLKYSYIPAPYSIYKNIYKLKPGTYLTISLKRKESTQKVYWSASDKIKSAFDNPFVGTRNEAIDQLNLKLTESIKKQMLADVPLGAFLSGGVDSSLVVAIMQKMSNNPVKTFSIGFAEDIFNEAIFAQQVSKHLKTDHTELYVTQSDALNVIPLLASLYDEPFADSSQIPTYIVAKLAQKSVTVSLSGDGADELFGGYNRYLLTFKLWNKISHIPLWLRDLISSLVRLIKPQIYNLVFKYFTFKGTILNLSNIGDKLHKAMNVLTSKSHFELYERLISSWDDSSTVVIGAEAPKEFVSSISDEFKDFDPISQMMAFDLLTYLPDDILCKVDRAAMGVSLETRVPFLDHNVMEFAWSLPLDFKIYNNKTKWVLREVLYKYVPKSLIERPKMGFGIPLDSWLRGDLKSWADDLLNENRLIKEGYFNPAPVRQKWEEHISGKRNWANHLWPILMFQSWLEANH